MQKDELKKILAKEKSIYLGSNEVGMKKKYHKRYQIWKYLYYFRVAKYYYELRKESTNTFQRYNAKLLYFYYEKKKNCISGQAGVEIGVSSEIGEGIDIWHGGVVINGNVGKNCTLHGNNIIGNKGKGKENFVPTIGNNVDIGAGAVVIGDVMIADNCIIGANATVIKSVKEEKSVIIGIPASVYLKKGESNE